MSAPLTSGVSPPQYSPGSWWQKNRTYNEQRQRVMRMYRTLWNDLRDITVAVQRLINVEHEWTVAPSMLVSEPRVPQGEHKLVSSYMYLLRFLTFCLFYFLYYKGRCVLILDKWPTERSLTYDEASIAIFSVHWLFFKKSFEGNQHIRCSNFLFSINILQRLQTSRAGRSHPWKSPTSW